MQNPMGTVREIDVLKNEKLNFDSSQAKIRSISSETIPIDQTGTDTNPKGGNRLWRMQWAWFREIDVLKNENLNFDSPQVKIHPNSSETIPIDPTGFNTNPKGGNRLWRMQWAWFREIDVLKMRTSTVTILKSRSTPTLLKRYQSTQRALIQTRRGEIDDGECN